MDNHDSPLSLATGIRLHIMGTRQPEVTECPGSRVMQLAVLVVFMVEYHHLDLLEWV